MSRISRIVSSKRQSNSGFHRSGQPKWWARTGEGATARFLNLEKTRGDRHLDCEVDVPVGTEVTIGVGRGKDGVRECVTTQPIL